MTKIQFTLGNSDLWHEIQLNYNLTGEKYRDEHDLSYIIKREQDRCKDYSAKRVKVLNENGDVLAESSDISEWNHLEYKNN